MNKTILLGRLTRDPEKKYANNKSIVNFTLAVRRRFQQNGQNEADFINCEAWSYTADFICSNFSKGDKIAVCGELRVSSYEKDGKTIHATKVVVDEAYFTANKIER